MSEPALRPAAFLDRDGTIIRELHHLSDPERVELIPGAAEGLRRLREAGFLLVVVTNQSGIARGLFDERAFEAVQERVEQVLAEQGVTLDGVWHCPHHPDYTGPCDCRKPGLLLFHQAAETLGIALDRSVYIGDRVQDVAPGLALGGTAILVRTGYGASHSEHAPAGAILADDLGDAAEHVVRHRHTVDTDRRQG